MRKLSWILDYVLLPLAILFVAYQPNFIHGFIDYHELGQQVYAVNEIFRGEVPYKDIFMQYGPLHSYLQSFLMLIFGKHVAVIRGFFLFGSIITLIIGYLLGRTIYKTRAVSYFLGLLLIMETFDPFWATRWGGLRFGAGLLALLCACISIRDRKNPWMLLGGMCTVMAFFFAIDVGMFSFLAIICAFSCYKKYHRAQDGRIDSSAMAFYFTGIAAAALPLMVYFWSAGALFPYISVTFMKATNHMTAWGQGLPDINFWHVIRPTEILKYPFKYYLPVFLYIAALARIVYRVLRSEISWRDYAVLSVVIYGFFMYAASLRAISNMQFQIAFQPALIVGAAFLDDILIGISILRQHLAVRRAAVLKLATLWFVFIICSTYAIVSEKRFYNDFVGWILYQLNKGRVITGYGRPGATSHLKRAELSIERADGIIVSVQQAEEIEGVAQYIRSVTGPDEPVFAFPVHGVFNFLCDRPCVGRFGNPSLAWLAPVYREEVLRDLRSARPRYIIYSNRLSTLAGSIRQKEELLPDVVEYIHENYEKETVFRGIEILRRKDS